MQTNRIIIHTQQLEKFEADMINEVDIKCFQTFAVHQLQNQNMQFIELSWEKKGCYQTIKELLDAKYLDFAFLSHFAEQIIDLYKACDDYLLIIDKIDFSPSNIYYDHFLNQFFWRYVPIKDFKSDFEISQLIAIVLLKSDIIDDLQTIENLSLSPKELLNWLKQLSNKKEASNKKKIWHRICPKKKSNQLINQQSKTTHKISHPILMVKANPNENYKLYFDHIVIGREDTCNIHINSPSVSREHALIVKTGHHYHVKDLGSTNGTFLNGKQIDISTPIVNGDCIQIGEKELIFIR